MLSKEQLVRTAARVLAGILLGATLGCPERFDLWIVDDAANVRFELAQPRGLLFAFAEPRPVGLHKLYVYPCNAPADTVWAVAHRIDWALLDREEWSQRPSWTPVLLGEVTYGEQLGPHYAIQRSPARLEVGRCYTIYAEATHGIGVANFAVRGDGGARAW